MLVGVAGFELATPCTPCKCATRLRYAPNELRILSSFFTKSKCSPKLGTELPKFGECGLHLASTKHLAAFNLRPLQCLLIATRLLCADLLGADLFSTDLLGSSLLSADLLSTGLFSTDLLGSSLLIKDLLS